VRNQTTCRAEITIRRGRRVASDCLPISSVNMFVIIFLNVVVARRVTTPGHWNVSMQKNMGSAGSSRRRRTLSGEFKTSMSDNELEDY
jgi:hypothetical protein